MRFWNDLVKGVAESGEMLRSTKQVYAFLRTVFKEGSFEVVTPFEFANEQLSYRTVIHPDADIYNYIPDFPTYNKKILAEYLRVSALAYKTHWEKVEEVFHLFDSNKKFWERFVDFSLVFANIGPTAFSIDQGTTESVVVSVGSIAFSILIRPWLKRKAFRLVFNALLKYGGRYFNF